MKEIKVRRYRVGDKMDICELVRKDVIAENIKDYSPEELNI